MGLLEQLFGIYRPQIPSPPTMTSIYPNSAANELYRGVLPVLNVNSLILKQGEVCHYVDKACLFTKKVEKHYRNTRRGSSFKVAKGWYYHTGTGERRPEEIELPVYTPGYLYITNKRIVFTAKEKSFEKSVPSLTSITSYSDAIGLQFGEKTFTLLIPSSIDAQKTLGLITK